MARRHKGVNLTGVDSEPRALRESIRFNSLVQSDSQPGPELELLPVSEGGCAPGPAASGGGPPVAGGAQALPGTDQTGLPSFPSGEE